MPAIFVVFWGVGDGNFSEDFVWWKVFWLGIELEKSDITHFPSKYEGKYIFCCLMFKFFVWKIAQEIPRKLTFQIKFDTKCLNLVQFLIENWLMWERFNTSLSMYASLAIKSNWIFCRNIPRCDGSYFLQLAPKLKNKILSSIMMYIIW